MQDYGTLAAARKHCEPLLKVTPTVRLQATRDKQNSTQPSSRTPDSIYLAVGTTQWSAPRSPQNEVTTRNRSALVTTTTSAPSQPSAECRRSRSKQQHGAGKQCTESDTAARCHTTPQRDARPLAATPHRTLLSPLERLWPRSTSYTVGCSESSRNSPMNPSATTTSSLAWPPEVVQLPPHIIPAPAHLPTARLRTKKGSLPRLHRRPLPTSITRHP